MRGKPYKRLGDNIAARLRKEEITQKELAEWAEIPTSSIQKYVQGFNCPSAVSLKKIARTLCCSMEDLLEGVE